MFASGKGLGAMMTKKSVDWIRGKELNSMINMVSKGKN